MPLEVCDECGWMHWHNDPCRSPKKWEVRKGGSKGSSAPLTAGEEASFIDVPEASEIRSTDSVGSNPTLPLPHSRPKRSGNRHRPGYFTEYMRDYRKGILRRPKPSDN